VTVENETRPPDAMTTETWDSMVTVGRIIRPHGHKGAVVVAPESDFAAERFQAGVELQWLKNGKPAPVRIASGRGHAGRWIVTIDGVATMNEAETLRGLELRVPAASLHALGPGTYYVHDLEGCAVVTAAGLEVGQVKGVQFGSGAPILVVDAGPGGEVLVPLVEGICRLVDPDAKRIVIDPPEGLIEVNRPARGRQA
jgi:16S rRNA processing protein RimM